MTSAGYVVDSSEVPQEHLVIPTATSQAVIADYWSGPQAPQRHFLPDGIQYFDFQPLNHGGRADYQAATQVDMNIDRVSRDVKIKGNLGADTDVLVNLCTVGWNMFRGGASVPFSKGVKSKGATLNQWLAQADPKIVDAYVNVLRRANPWLTSELTVAEIDQQIEDLQKQRIEVSKTVEGN